MIRVAAITSSRDDPSSRFRMRQFVEPLRPLGVEVVEFRPWISKYASAAAQLTGLGLGSRAVAAIGARRCDLTWLNRELVTGHMTVERFIGQRRLFDVDDAIWLHGRRDFAKRIAKACLGVIAGNARIADYFRGVARCVWTVPTAVDTNVWTAARRPHDEFVVGWSGTRWNLPYLHAIEEPLARFLADAPEAFLLVVCDRRPVFRRLPSDRVRFTRWSPDTEVTAVQSMDVGLMPLSDDEWTRAKCAVKMLCCLSAGVPVISSPVGAAAEILARAPLGLAARSPDDWYDGLTQLYRDRDRGRTMGQEGRRVVERHYAATAVAGQLAAIFREAVQAS